MLIFKLEHGIIFKNFRKKPTAEKPSGLKILRRTVSLLELRGVVVFVSEAGIALINPLVDIGNDEGGEGKSDDETDEAEEGSPDGEREEHHGGIEAHGLAHDAGREDHVLDGLHHGEDGECGEQDEPETATGVVGLQEGKHDGGNDADHLKVRNEVEQTDEESEADGHREVDDAESDGEEYADTEGDKRLTTEIVAHVGANAIGDVHHLTTTVLGPKARPTFGDLLIVEQDEEQIEQRDAEGDQSTHDMKGLRQDATHTRDDLLDDLDEIAVLQLVEPIVVGDVRQDKLLEQGGHALVLPNLGQIGGDETLQAYRLVDERGDDEHEEACHDAYNEQQHHDDAEDTIPESRLLLKEDHDRIEQIGDAERDEERQQHAAQIVDQREDCNKDYCKRDDAYQTIEGDWLGHSKVN